MDFTVMGTDDEWVNRRATLLFAGLSVAWGIPYLLIKVSVDEISPLALVLFRTALGALLLLPLAQARGVIRPVLGRWRLLLLYAAVEISVPWWLLSHAETRLTSSLSGLLIATVPLAGIGIGMLTRRHERLGLGGAAGLAVGLLGVAFLVGVDVGGSDLWAVAELVGVVLCYAYGAALMGHNLRDLPGLGVVALSLAAAAVGYLVLALLVPGSLPSQVPSGTVVASVVTLGVVCTAGALLMMFALVAEIGPVRATTFTYVNPAVAILAGAVVLHEPVTPATGVGFVLVLLGSALVTRRPRVPGAASDAAVECGVGAAAIVGTPVLGPTAKSIAGGAVTGSMAGEAVTGSMAGGTVTGGAVTGSMAGGAVTGGAVTGSMAGGAASRPSRDEGIVVEVSAGEDATSGEDVERPPVQASCGAATEAG